jgi:hypothetical protein
MQDVHLFNTTTIGKADFFNSEETWFIVIVRCDLSPILRNHIQIVNYMGVRDCTGYEWGCVQSGEQKYTPHGSSKQACIAQASIR